MLLLLSNIYKCFSFSYIMDSLIDGTRSKLNLTKRIIENHLDVPIPNSTYKYYGQSLQSIKADFDAMKKPVIARGSTKYDYFADIDVAPTQGDINTFNQLAKFITKAEHAIDEPEVKFHRNDYGLKHTPEIDFLIQEQSPSKFIGSMIRNPHTGDIHIEYTNIETLNNDDSSRPAKTNADYFRNTYLCHYDTDISKEEIMQLISVFEKMEHSELLIDSYTHQMEFSLSPLFFFQMRLFKKIEPVANFEVPNPKDYPIVMTGYRNFGITPPEGIELPIQKVTHLNRNHPHIDFDNPYGIVLRIKQTITPNLETSFRNLSFFGSPCYHIDYLFHGNYRPMQRANLVMIHPSIESNKKIVKSSRVIYSDLPGLNIPLYDNLDKFEKSRIFSNGNDINSITVFVSFNYLVIHSISSFSSLKCSAFFSTNFLSEFLNIILI